MGNNMSLGYDEEDEQEQQERVEQEQQERQERQEPQEQQEHVEQEDLNKNHNIKKSSIKNKEYVHANASVSESVSESIQAHESKIKKRKQTIRNSKALKKAGKTKSNKRILKEYQSRYLHGEKERERGKRCLA